MKDKVELVKGRLEETKLPYDSFQFIVSEWMGYFLLFEVVLNLFMIKINSNLNGEIGTLDNFEGF